MKKTDTKTNVLLTDDPALVRAAAAQNRPVVYYERPGAEAVYEADYTVQSLDELDELFFQRVYERHYGLPWCIGETEQLKIRESTEEDVEKLLAFFTDEEARRWLFEGEGKLFSEEEQREKLKAYVRNCMAFMAMVFTRFCGKKRASLQPGQAFRSGNIRENRCWSLAILRHLLSGVRGSLRRRWDFCRKRWRISPEK